MCQRIANYHRPHPPLSISRICLTRINQNMCEERYCWMISFLQPKDTSRRRFGERSGFSFGKCNYSILSMLLKGKCAKLPLIFTIILICSSFSPPPPFLCPFFSFLHRTAGEQNRATPKSLPGDSVTNCAFTCQRCLYFIICCGRCRPCYL